MATIDGFFEIMVSEGGGDLSVSVGSPSTIRVSGEPRIIGTHEPTRDVLQAMAAETRPVRGLRIFEETGRLDLGTVVPGRFYRDIRAAARLPGARARELRTPLGVIERPGVARLYTHPAGFRDSSAPRGETEPVAVDIVQRRASIRARPLPRACAASTSSLRTRRSRISSIWARCAATAAALVSRRQT